MKKDKLLELYQKFKNEKRWIQQIRQLRNYKDGDIEIILNSKYPYVMSEIILNYEFKILNENQQNEIIKSINNAKNEEVAECIYLIVRSGTILSSGKTVEISNIICNSEEVSVIYAKEIALSNTVILNKDGLELIKIVGKSKKKEQALTSKLIAQDLNVLVSGNAIELTKLASLTEGEEQRRAVLHISTNRDVISSDVAIKLANLASKIKTDDIAQLVITIASDKILEKNKRSTYYLTRMLLENKYEDVLKIYNEAQKLISYIKIQESKAEKDNGTFWNMYKQNPEEAITLLKTKVSSTEEINPYTRIKKK